LLSSAFPTVHLCIHSRCILLDVSKPDFVSVHGTFHGKRCIPYFHYGNNTEKIKNEGIQVHGFKLLKQLKKKLRSKRRWLALGVILILVTVCSIAYKYTVKSENVSIPASQQALSSLHPTVESEELAKQQEIMDAIAKQTGKLEAFKQKAYVCGEEQQKLGALDAGQIMQLHKEHPSWVISQNESNEVYFTERVDDLSPECKQKAYFGMDESGNLSLFNGLPSKENVIRTFFQLNIHYLESSLPKETLKQLHEGIRVTDLAEYNSVLSTFSDYAVEETKRAMFPKEALPE
jgi:forespore regulator of the sigma-K checkpoint